MFDDLIRYDLGMPLRDFPKQRLHSRVQCKETKRAGGPKACVIHRPTVHLLTGAAQVVRASTIIEDLCAHGVGHPNPDSAAYLNWRDSTTAWGTHGCDGCCGPVPRAEQ